MKNKIFLVGVALAITLGASILWWAYQTGKSKVNFLGNMQECLEIGGEYNLRYEPGQARGNWETCEIDYE